jgi:hypothetical protein
VKLPQRAAASKARKALSGGRRREDIGSMAGFGMSFTHAVHV